VRDARARLIVGRLPRPGETVSLAPEEAAHARARRIAAGDAVLLLDGTGRSVPGEVVRVTRGEVLARATGVVELSESGPAISLYVAGLRAERLAWVVEKATELGVARVVLVTSARTQSFRSTAAVLPRLERVARAAAKQSERSDWPAVTGPTPLGSALRDEESEARFFLDLDGEPFPRRVLKSSSALLVGPEGGWTDEERNDASDRGWQRVTLPAGKLRAETAVIAALVLLRAAMDRKTG
jgi:16S rRNA (uracil1498-N3)-methyltransferase